jgi:hypothetical protein
MSECNALYQQRIPPKDPVYEEYFKFWSQYYEQTETYDRYLSPKHGRPCAPHHHRLMNQNARRVYKDLEQQMHEPIGWERDKEKWAAAKMEALRQHERKWEIKE